MPSRRVLRIAQTIRQEVSTIVLFELKDPRIKSVTVTKAEVSPDLRHARVFVSVMAPDKDVELVFHGLNHARSHVQNLVGEKLGLRFSPTIEFVEDESVKKSLHFSELIKKAMGR